MSTTIALTRPGVLVDLVAYGAKAAGTPSLVEDGLQLPMPVDEVEFMPAARFLTGEPAVSRRTPNSVLAMQVRFEAVNEASHQALITAWRVALRQLAYESTVNLGGLSTTWRSFPGSIVLANANRRPIITGQPVVDLYTITIPVYPIPVT